MTGPAGGRTRRRFLPFLPVLLLAFLLSGCSADDGSSGGPFARHPTKLSAWELFEGATADHVPRSGVEPYDLNTALFSDHALKLRFVRLPRDENGNLKPARYRADGPLEFPVGTVISKTFAYPADFRRPDDDLRPLETRLLLHESDGWVGLPYIWNADGTDATLAIAGGPLTASWIDADGAAVHHEYRVPNANQCKTCHRTDGEHVLPIGPQAGLLNRSFAYRAPGGEVREENQLERWQRIGLLADAPALDELPRSPVWNDEDSGSLDERARTWLDVNCAHCHNLTGSGRTSGLDLRGSHHNRTMLGIWKHPVAAGLGTGDRLYSIVPGRPDESILVYRIESTHPGVMMPEIGRSLVDREAVALIREWISAMPDGDAGPVADFRAGDGPLPAAASAPLPAATLPAAL